ncbi:FAD-binding domain-containing protein [Paraburkholderia adhaesiva]|uniref:FAD-binding domain-containing protein n=1 Tax=Paraburkholderia adhaesiva TaxID=2883244 RepID=UPI001F298FB8|nr:FAD-binding domain-containing protein [Paraburkholderia adhaesiva]
MSPLATRERQSVTAPAVPPGALIHRTWNAKAQFFGVAGVRFGNDWPCPVVEALVRPPGHSKHWLRQENLRANKVAARIRVDPKR